MANRGSFPNIATRNANQQAMVDAGLTTGDTCTVDDIEYNWQNSGWESPWPRPTYPGGGSSVTLTGTVAELLAMSPPAATTVAQGTDAVDCILVSTGSLWRGSVGTHESVEALALLSTTLLEGGTVTAIIRGFGTALLSTNKSVWLVQPATPQIAFEA